MRGSGRIFVILGILLAIIAGIAVFVVLANAEPQPETVPTTKVVFAIQQIPARSEISPDQIGEFDWPQTVQVPLGAFENPGDVVGKISKNPIYAGQPIINEMLISKDELETTHSNAALILEKGQVGVALGLSLNSSVAEAIQVGDRVDLIVTYATDIEGGSSQYQLTQKTLENVLILQVGPWPRSVGEQSSQSGGTVNIVTLQMAEQDALALQHLSATASEYNLVLRAANDDQLFTTEPVTLEYLNKRFNFNIPGLAR